MHELRRVLPDANILALGGDKVEEAGANVIYRIEDVNSIIGISGVVANLPKLARIERGLKRILDRGVDLFIPVDYPGMNLRLAEHAKRGGAQVLYYISPQVWAWGRARIRKMARFVDFMAVILPFEEEIYRDEGIPVEFVGHPLVEDSSALEPRDQGNRSGIGLLPGSRSQEVRRILPVLLKAAEKIRTAHPSESFSVGLSPSVPRSLYEEIIRKHRADYVALDDNSLHVMQGARLLLVASGTATLQGALFETPLIIVYRVSLVNYLIARWLVKVEHIGLVNIILGEEICPEFVQIEAKPSRIATEAIRILENRDVRDSMLSRFGELRGMLSGRGGSRRVAEISQQLLVNSS